MCTLTLPYFRHSFDKVSRCSSYPEVGQIIAKQNLDSFRGIPFEALLQDQQISYNLHRYCIDYMDGDPMIFLQEPYSSYRNAWNKWIDENVDEILHFSQILHDHQYEYSGRFDLICRLKNGSISLINLKIGSLGKSSWMIELAALNRLCQHSGYMIRDSFVVNLVDEGNDVSAKVIRPNDCSYDWDVFEGALNCFKYFNNQGK